jgi:hypothetical protein
MTRKGKEHSGGDQWDSKSGTLEFDASDNLGILTPTIAKLRHTIQRGSAW